MVSVGNKYLWLFLVNLKIKWSNPLANPSMEVENTTSYIYSIQGGGLSSNVRLSKRNFE